MLESKFSNFQLLPTHSELQLGSFEGMPCKMLHKAGGSYALMQEKLEANLKPWWRLSQTLRQNLGVFGMEAMVASDRGTRASSPTYMTKRNKCHRRRLAKRNKHKKRQCVVNLCLSSTLGAWYVN